MLTVELGDESRVVEIHCDRDGLETLIRHLKSLRRAGEHVHLKTPSWAGAELTEVRHGKSTTLVNHLVVGLQGEEAPRD